MQIPRIKKLFFKQKGRFLINKDFSAEFVLAAGNHESIKCQSCAGSDKKCCHIAQILKELGFCQKTVELVKQKKCPGECEFVLDDTFFHFRSISNAPNTPHQDAHINWDEVNEKFRKFHLLIDDILAS